MQKDQKHDNNNATPGGGKLRLAGSLGIIAAG